VIVVDTNVIAYLLIRTTHSADADRAFARDWRWVAPFLWRSEFRNVLTRYLASGLMNLTTAIEYFHDAQALMQDRELQPDSATVLTLAAQSACSAYDCEFVALAQELGVLLVTADRKLAAKFRTNAIHLREFVRASRP
jgi:predicted nucleic acid-binding protein